MAVDKIKPLKFENSSTGGTQIDYLPTEANPTQDYLAGKGISFENNDNRLIDLDGSGNIQFKDATETSAKTVRQLRTALQNIFDNSTNGFSATDVQSAIEEASNFSTLDLALFGDGSDGNVSLSSGTTTLSRTMYYNNLTLSSTAILNPNGFHIYVKGTLAISGTASITYNGAAGGNAANGTAGTGAAAQNGSSTEVGVPAAGGNGASGAGAAGSVGTVPSTFVGLGGDGGPGGAGGASGTGASGGAQTGTPVVTYRPERSVLLSSNIGPQGSFKRPGQGGAGGSSGGAQVASLGGGGGGGGSGGGFIAIHARIFNSTSSVGVVANGGNGGNGGNGTVVNAGGGGGGGGAGGGYISIIAKTITALGTLTVTGGSGGNGGGKVGSGVVGSVGTSGSTGHYAAFEVDTQTWTAA